MNCSEGAQAPLTHRDDSYLEQESDAAPDEEVWDNIQLDKPHLQTHKYEHGRDTNINTGIESAQCCCYFTSWVRTAADRVPAAYHCPKDDVDDGA